MAIEVDVQVLTDIKDSLSKLVELQTQAAKSFGAVADSAKNVEEATTGITGALKGATEAALGFIGAHSFEAALHEIYDSFRELTIGVGEFGAQLQVQSSKIGLTVEALQEFRFAGEEVGLSIGQVDNALQFLSKNLGLARLNIGESAQALKLLKENTGANIDLTKGLDQQITQVLDAFSKLQDNSVRAALAQQLFGRSGIELNNILRLGGKGLSNLREEAEKYGIVTTEQAQNGKRFEDAQLHLTAAIQGVRNEIGNAFVPAMTRSTQALADFIAASRETVTYLLNNLPQITAAMIKFGEAALAAFIVFRGGSIVSTVQGAFSAVVSGASNAVTALKGVAAAISVTEIALVGLKAAATFGLFFIIDAVVSLVQLFAQVVRSGGSFGDAFKAVFLTIANFFRSYVLDPFLELGAAMLNLITQVPVLGDKFKSALGPAIEGINKLLSDNRDQIEENVKEIDKLTKGKVQAPTAQTTGTDTTTGKEKSVQPAAIAGGIIAAFQTGGVKGAAALAQTIGQSFGPVGQLIGQAIGFLAQGGEAVKKQITSVLDAIPELIVNVVDGVLAVVDVIIDKILSGDLIGRILEKVPGIITKIFDRLPTILVNGLANPTIWVPVARAIIRNIPDIVRAFSEGLAKAAPEFVQQLIDSIKPGGKSGGAIGGGVGGGISGILGALPHFASGGDVVARSSATDSVIAAVSDGEKVLKPDTAVGIDQMVAAFRQGRLGGGGGKVEAVFKINERELSRQLIDMDTRGVPTRKLG